MQVLKRWELTGKERAKILVAIINSEYLKTDCFVYAFAQSV